MTSPTTFVFWLKIVLITVGAISIALATKFAVPYVVAFSLYDVPIWWNSVIQWLKPPYLYFVVNGIIIIIAAISWFGNHNHPGYNSAATGGQSQPHVRSITVRTPPGPPPPPAVVAAVVLAEAPQPEADVYECGHWDQGGNSGAAEVVELKAVVVNSVHQLEYEDGDGVANDEGWIVPISDFTSPQGTAAPEVEEADRLDFASPVKEKPLVLSTRFRHHITGSPPEGRRARRIVERPKRREQQPDTLENTWKMITEERHAPLGRQFKKSDTWVNQGREVALNSLDLLELPLPQHVAKSATFRDRTDCLHDNGQPPTIREEPSSSQEELNRRFEEFIKSFKEEMRLQRQKSLNQYMEKIDRGAY